MGAKERRSGTAQRIDWSGHFGGDGICCSRQSAERIAPFWSRSGMGTSLNPSLVNDCERLGNFFGWSFVCSSVERIVAIQDPENA